MKKIKAITALFFACFLGSALGCHSVSPLSSQESGTEEASLSMTDSPTGCARSFDCDGDTVFNSVDNCMEEPNWNQRDTDQDGFGDLCDQDKDGDGLENDLDLCPIQKNNICTYNILCQVSQQKSLTTCISEIGGAGGTIVFTGNQEHSLRPNTPALVVPQHIKIRVENGARISVAAGKTLQLDGPFESDSTTALIFTGVGAVYLMHPDTIAYAAWWGHSPNNNYQRNDEILQKVMASMKRGGLVQLGEGIFEHKKIEIANNVVLQGADCFYLPPPDQDFIDHCGTVIRLPDFPNANESALMNAPSENFITAISRTIRVSIKNIEYDGNAAANRNWIGRNSNNRYPRWTLEDRDTNESHGIFLGNYQGRVPPQYTWVENVYIHDTIRDGIVLSGSRLYATHLRVKNSDIDHLLYLAQNLYSRLENILLEGFWGQEAMVTSGNEELNNLIFKNIEQNPLALNNAQTPFETLNLLTRRSTSSPRHSMTYQGPTIIHQLSAEIKAVLPLVGLQSHEALEVHGATFYQLERREEPLIIFNIHSARANTSAQKHFLARETSYFNAEGPITFLNIQGDNALQANSISIQDSVIHYQDGAVVSDTAYLAIRDHMQNLAVSRFTVCNGAAPLLVTANRLNIQNIQLSEINACDASPPFFMQLNSGRNVRIQNSKLSQFSPAQIHVDNDATVDIRNVVACDPSTQFQNCL